MGSVLFTNVRIIDGTGAQPYAGEVLIQGNRIARIGRGARSLPTAGVTIIDGAGAESLLGFASVSRAERESLWVLARVRIEDAAPSFGLKESRAATVGATCLLLRHR